MRTLHHIYATALRYFWVPCPLCGRYFGGHETFGTVTVDGKVTCHRHVITGSLKDGVLENTFITL